MFETTTVLTSAYIFWLQVTTIEQETVWIPNTQIIRVKQKKGAGAILILRDDDPVFTIHDGQTIINTICQKNEGASK